MSDCPKCGEDLSWLSGSPAHPDNLYCEKCDYKAWDRDMTEINKKLQELSDPLLEFTRSEVEAMLKKQRELSASVFSMGVGAPLEMSNDNIIYKIILNSKLNIDKEGE